MNIKHSSRSDLWYTPTPILSLVREVLGPILLDPASDEMANSRVQAAKYFYKDALLEDWSSPSIFCNPPGSKIGNKSQAALFWAKLMNTRDASKLGHAIFMAFSVEALQTTQNVGTKAIGQFPFCVPSKRIKFDLPDGTTPDSPSHANMIVYVPGQIDKTDLFFEVFSSLGNVLNTKRLP